jgi:UrcA family protein
MTQQVSLISRMSSAAMLALAVLPMAALATAADAASVRVSDINLSTSQGVAAYEQRAEAAALKFCADQRGVNALSVCRAGVKAELAAKFETARMAQLANPSKTFAAR